jgi:hypothetical protein
VKLEGSLDAFSLPDIFQLLSYTKKTGGLRLQHAGALGVVHFVEGAVTGASTGRGRQALARRVVGAGLVDRDELAAAVTAAVDAGTGLVPALVAGGSLTPEHAALLVTEHTHDTVFELLRWPAGEFAFAPDEVNADDVGVRLAPDEVVTHAVEQRSAWDAAASVVPSPESVAVLVGATEDVVVRPEDWAVLRLVDGRRRIADIVELAGAGQFAIVTALAALVDRGVIAVQDEPAASTDITAALELLAPLESGDDTPVRTPAEAAPAAAEPAQAAVTQKPVAAKPATEKPATEKKAANKPDATAAPARAARPAPASAFSAPTRPEPTRADSTVVTLPDQAASAPAAPAAPAAPEPSVAPAARTRPTSVPDPAPDPAPASPTSTAPRLGGAHVPGDVVPPRPEPFLAPRRPEFGEQGPGIPGGRPPAGSGGSVVGSTAVAAEQLVERDPNVNRSLLLRLIAGVRGL